MSNVAALQRQIRGAPFGADLPEEYLRIPQVPSPRPINWGAPCADGPPHHATGLMGRVGAQPTTTPLYQQILHATDGTIQLETVAGV